MTDFPALFPPEMAEAVDKGRKTMSRRLQTRKWKSVKPGDRIWVREPYWRWGMFDANTDGTRSFHAICAPLGNICFGEPIGHKAKNRNETFPSWHRRAALYMPKHFSRFTLIVTETKIEPLHSISEADAIAEGVDPTLGHPVLQFSYQWISIHGRKNWSRNPDVIAVTFRVIRANIDELSPPHQTHTDRLLAG